MSTYDPKMVRRDLINKIKQLEASLAEAEAALPAHTIRPHQMQRVMELEEALEKAQKALLDFDGK